MQLVAYNTLFVLIVMNFNFRFFIKICKYTSKLTIKYF